MTLVPLHTVTWPAERFYWATLPPGVVRRDGVLAPGAIEAAREQIPVPMENLHAVAITIDRARGENGTGGVTGDSQRGGSGGIVCAIEREVLRTLDAGVLILTPDSIPACVLSAMGHTPWEAPDACREPSYSTSLDAGSEASAPKVRVAAFVSQHELAPHDLTRLNLLTGEFEPRAIRSHRHRRAAIVLGAITISCAVVAFDLARRAELLRRAAGDDAAAVRAVLAQAALAQDPGAPDALALERELEQLRAVASRTGPGASFDAPSALSEIVGGWPSAGGALPQSLSVRPDAATLTVRTPGAPAAFLSAWKTPAGWTSAEPRVQANAQGGGEGGLVTLELKQLTAATSPKGGAP
ncbi:MAG: hypothetical protein IT434_18200 [Phycisphaerales bacterium]|jgi:hypothetical protein|nr:hypothetical protein [Phycisphaerales bacterium]